MKFDVEPLKKITFDSNQEKFWIRKIFTEDLNEYYSLDNNECWMAPQARKIDEIMDSLKGNIIKLEKDYGESIKTNTFKVGDWEFHNIEGDSLLDFFKPDLDNIILVIDIDEEGWRGSVSFKNWMVHEIVAVNLEDDDELILYKDKPIKYIKREKIKKGNSISTRYTYK